MKRGGLATKSEAGWYFDILDAREQDAGQECSHTLGVAPSAADRANYLAQKSVAATPPPASPTLVPRG